MADMSTLKRLVFEGQTMLLAQLRDQVVNPDAASTRKLPAVERSTKMQNLKARLAGVVIEKALEPSYSPPGCSGSAMGVKAVGIPLS